MEVVEKKIVELKELNEVRKVKNGKLNKKEQLLYDHLMSYILKNYRTL